MKCTKMCSEPCNRTICSEPSKGIIRKCNHECIGICGEKVPRTCRLCNSEELCNIFFGNEDEKNAQFIELRDCGHTHEINGLLKWLQSSNNEENNKAIQMKRCPRCSTVIRKTKALKNIVAEIILNKSNLNCMALQQITKQFNKNCTRKSLKFYIRINFKRIRFVSKQCTNY